MLKALIEYSKARKRPIYACYVDLKKAYDTVWRNGLLYKLVSNYNLSPKFVRILRAMNTNLNGSVKIDGLMGEWFAISIGVIQG